MSADMDSLTFTSQAGKKFIVCAVIEYKISPDHFTLWQRKVTANTISKFILRYHFLLFYGQALVQKQTESGLKPVYHLHSSGYDTPPHTSP